jgi:hypothetical protein
MASAADSHRPLRGSRKHTRYPANCGIDRAMHGRGRRRRRGCGGWRLAGFVGFISCFCFVRTIYGSIKGPPPTPPTHRSPFGSPGPPIPPPSTPAPPRPRNTRPCRCPRAAAPNPRRVRRTLGKCVGVAWGLCRARAWRLRPASPRPDAVRWGGGGPRQWTERPGGASKRAAGDRAAA